MDYTIIKKLRTEYHWTQEEVAGMLGISRVTYNLLENGKTPRDPYITALQDVFDVSFSALQDPNKPKINRSLDSKTYSKAKDFILYILGKTAQFPTVGKTVLYKILYFCEFDRYELTGQRLTGMDFVKLPRGPAPTGFDFAIQKMSKEGSIIPVNAKYMGYTQQRYLINKQISDSFLTEKEKKFVDQTIQRFQNMNASEISEYSHGDIPWKATPDMELIDIHLANHRQYPYSIKARAEKFEQDKNNFTDNPAFAFLLDEPDLYEDMI